MRGHFTYPGDGVLGQNATPALKCTTYVLVLIWRINLLNSMKLMESIIVKYSFE